MMTLRPAVTRGQANFGWLDSRHTFSFGDYYDPKWMGYRGLRVINDDRVAPGMGFGTHPHRDMEIITYVLSGELEHKDSMGNGRVIRAGEVQYMAAGTGVRHSEYNHSQSDEVHFLQIWIEPDQQGLLPSYADRALGDAPKGSFQLVASKTGRNGSFTINQDADLWIGRFAKGDHITHHLSAGRHAWVQIAEGEVLLDGVSLKTGDGAAVGGQSSLDFLAESNSQVLLFDLI
jgi:redox-sensitive bicupin YhaK (pirin superfamily)